VIWRAAFGPRILFALALGLGSGALAYGVQMPLPWMLGPMICLTIAALAGLPIEGPARMRPFVIPVIGVMLGSSLTPEVAAAVPRWTATMLLLPAFLTVAAALSYALYRRIGGLDHATAYFAAMPGGLNEMIILGHAAGGDDRRIAMAHACRVLIVILCVSLFFGYFLGVSTTGGQSWVPLGALGWRDWAIMIGAGVLGTPLGRRLRLPAHQLFGPMVLSGIAHVSGLVHVPPPTLFVIAAQLVIGTTIGCRFAGISPRLIARDMGLALLSSTSMIAVAVVFAALVHWWTRLPMEQAFLAYSPGGLTEMSLLALAMHQDVAYVAVTHVVRIVMVIAGAAALFRRVR
jgi:membrane AbrB-like protein